MDYISLSALESLRSELSSSASLFEYVLDKELKKASLELYIISSLGIKYQGRGII